MSDGRSVDPQGTAASGWRKPDSSPAIDLALDGDNAVIWLSGDIDLAVADHLVELGTLAVADPRIAELALDFSQTTLLDSAGVSALVELTKYGAVSDVPITLRGVPPVVARVLNVTQVGKIVGVTDADTGRC